MSFLDGNLCFDIGTHVEVSGVLENSIVVLATQIQRLYWSMLKISGFNRHLSMIIQIRIFRTREAPPFMAGSSHHSLSEKSPNFSLEDESCHLFFKTQIYSWTGASACGGCHENPSRSITYGFSER